MRLLLASLALVGIAIFLMAGAHPRHRTPLWPDARYTREDRDRAIQRGLNFIYDSIARNPHHFHDWGHDLLAAFYNIAVTSENRELRRMAWNMGHERALEYRRLHPTVPAGIQMNDLTDLVFGDDAAARLGVPDPRVHTQLRLAAARFSVYDYLLFDPVKEPPPSDIPKACRKCDHQNPRGATVCERCGAPLKMWNRYDLYQDALINTYTGDRTGITLGAHYVDVLHWLPALRPYPARKPGNDDDYYAGVYTVTHVVYTYNDYSQFRLSPDCFPEEFEHLKANLRQAVIDKDPETMGEFLDSLRSFGLTYDDPHIRAGFAYLLSVQNPDGSWG
ncbi:MAG TPA: hypothetical protein VGH38_29380, partial [Bryobacteraceae bacterium]